MHQDKHIAGGDGAPVAAHLITHEALEEEAGYGDAEEMRLILFCYYVFSAT